jgi:uncharacterized protein (TIGR02679 family)
VSELPAWVRDPALRPVWQAAHERLERHRLEPSGHVTVRGLDRAARHAVSGLLGRAVTRDVVRIDLTQLDGELLARTGRGLVAVVGQLAGPLTDRAGARSEHERARAAPFEALRAWFAEHPGAVRTWTEAWLAEVRSSGLLSRVGSPETASRALVHAAQIATAVSDEVTAPVARTELAASCTGDAHALDDGSLIGALVLRALARSLDRPAPRTPTERRQLWEAVGVTSDRVSTTVLTLGLRPLGDEPPARRLRLAADDGDPVHLTSWDLDRGALRMPRGRAVLVCENPRVLEAAAAVHGGACAVVCTSGMPGSVAVRLLERLGAEGVALRYHGDFDWPGIAIANRLVATVGCVPWLMTADDYVAGLRADGLPLTGREVTPLWDASLGATMCARGVAVHEEAVLDGLLPVMPSLASE